MVLWLCSLKHITSLSSFSRSNYLLQGWCCCPRQQCEGWGALGWCHFPQVFQPLWRSTKRHWILQQQSWIGVTEEIPNALYAQSERQDVRDISETSLRGFKKMPFWSSACRSVHRPSLHAWLLLYPPDEIFSGKPFLKSTPACFAVQVVELVTRSQPTTKKKLSQGESYLCSDNPFKACNPLTVLAHSNPSGVLLLKLGMCQFWQSSIDHHPFQGCVDSPKLFPQNVPRLDLLIVQALLLIGTLYLDIVFKV